VPQLLDLLAAELERPRPLSAQVVKHLSAAHDVERDGATEFLATQLPALEDYEVDLLLSPLFTPSLEDQAAVAQHLGATSIPEAEWAGLIAQLGARPTPAHLLADDGRTLTVPLREVTIERYVRRLRLHGTIPAGLMEVIETLPAAERARVQAIARRAIWEAPGRRALLEKVLRTTPGAWLVEDLAGLLRLVETYEPADAPEFLARLPHWQQVLRHEINLASHPKTFFNERIEDMHGGGRDRRAPEAARIASREAELALLERLARVLGQ